MSTCETDEGCFSKTAKCWMKMLKLEDRRSLSRLAQRALGLNPNSILTNL